MNARVPAITAFYKKILSHKKSNGWQHRSRVGPDEFVFSGFCNVE
ncbi:hypothetical protein LEP1GSC060_3583 [Leptospira weilii serovar Ranarum str. ICFT]|uniref:Uncharacterized protein n=1 Tax=Leptospira weilii serovar Ranarum str. ICFT TaxID=1218598 RepID=N1WJI9_9LEPT|nr:hypothetical protein LEP1GSC060_3583 [Leptospira weilii serovar Ranarum str. ICFT]